MFEDGVGGDTLHAVMADLASDVSQGSGPRVGWFYGFTSGLQTFNEGLF